MTWICKTAYLYSLLSIAIVANQDVLGQSQMNTAKNSAWTARETEPLVTSAQPNGFNITNSNNDTLMHVGENGNVGIGTRAPLQFTGAGGPATYSGTGVHIKTSNQGRFILEGDGVSSEWIDNGGAVNAKIISLLVDNGVASFQSKNDNLTTIMDNILSMDLGGNVGIGTATPMEKLHVDGNVRIGGTLSLDTPPNSPSAGTPIEVLRISSGDDTNLQTGPGNNLVLNAGNSMSFFTNDPSLLQTKMVISSIGNIGIGTGNSPTDQLHTTGSVRFANFGAGTLQTSASGELFVSSDIRLKRIKGYFRRGLAAISKIDPISYSWNEESGLETEHTYTGFSAQNVQDVIPEAVSEDKNGYLTLSDRPIIATLVNAVKELKAENEKLKAQMGELTSMKAKMVKLEAALEKMKIRTAKAGSHNDSGESKTVASTEGHQ